MEAAFLLELSERSVNGGEFSSAVLYIQTFRKVLKETDEKQVDQTH